MRAIRVLLAAVVMSIASGTGAQPATYDGVTGELTIPSVAVGTSIFGGVKLQNTGNFVFSLKDARAQPAITSAEGIWRGLLADSLMTWIHLDNGFFYIFQSSVDNPNVIEGFVHGSAASGNGTFTAPSVTAFDFYEQQVMTFGPITGKYWARQWIAFSAPVYMGAHFDSSYDAVPTLAELAGTYNGEARFGPPFAAQTLATTIDPYGAVAGNVGSCAFAGVITPRSRGNLYDVTVQFGAGCDFAGQAFAGIVFLDPVTHRLMVAALNASRTVGGMFIATR